MSSKLDILKMTQHGDQKHTVVLLDEHAGGIGALNLARAIRKRSDIDSIKVIMFSAESAGTNSTEIVDAWIVKPVRPSHLYSLLLQLCGNTNGSGADAFAAAPHNSISIEQPHWRKAIRVLLVDDNLINRTVGAHQLSVLGYSAELVDSARRGLEAVSSGRSDIVLMDCEMPDMDGYEAVAEIRRREGTGHHTVIIALTAHATADDRARCLDAGMDDYLSKPVKLQTLAEMLDTWAQRKLN